MNKNKYKGNNGELFTADYLKFQNFKVFEMNYHSRYGEIDIICKNDKYIIFVEVKARRSNSMSRGAESVGKIKRIKIIKTAFVYLINHSVDLQPRFDVAEVDLDDKGTPKSLNYIEDAFSAEEYGAFF